MWSAGVSVIFSLVPEARQLLDELPQCIVLSFEEIRVRRLPDLPKEREMECLRLSRGIPRLVRALVPQSSSGDGSDSFTSAYYDALASLARMSVRMTLSDEERAVRLAMLLLGNGSVSELGSVIGRDVRETISGIVADAPLFGVGDDLASFDCLTSLSTASLAACLRRIETICALFPGLVAACLRVLVSRGDLGRAALIATLPEASDAYDAIAARGADFLDAGEVGLVRRVASMKAASDPASLALLSAASAIGGREPIVDAGEGADDPVLLFVDARRLLLGLPPLVLGGERATDALSRRLWVHRVAGDLMARGRFSEAMRLVVSASCERGRPSVSSALLEIDLELARVMCGDPLTEDRRVARAIDEAALPGLVDGITMVRLVKSVLAGGGDEAEAESLSSRAERSGETLVRVVALLAGSVIDQRSSAFARANIRASIAVSLASKAGLDYLQRVASIFCWLARLRMGEEMGSAPREFANDDLGSVCSLIMTAVGSGVSTTDDEARAVPWEALWLLRIIFCGFGEFSELVECVLPASWRRALSAQMAGVPKAGVLRGASPRENDATGDGGAPIRLCLLGGFSLYVRGVHVPDWKLEQRSAKSMLEYMVLESGARTKRFALVEQVWPDCDYVTGLNRVYQATSLLRRAISSIDRSLNPFVTNRTSHEVSVDTSLISCDVDEFRTLAREASDADEDERALALARQAEALYVGDLYLPMVDATGYIAATRDDLRRLYCDAMVAGADAALRLGRPRTAVRLTRNVLDGGDLREDAEATLVRALRESGRPLEAERAYLQFESRLAEEGRDPSPWLLRSVGKTALPPGATDDPGSSE